MTSVLAERPSPVALAHPQRAIAIAAVLGAMAMVVLDAGLSNVALPTIGSALKVAPSQAILVVAAYQAALVMTLLQSAAAGARFGSRNIFALGVALFIAASAMSAFAPAFTWLIAARFVQGIGAAAVMALGVALLRAIVSDARLSAAISWNALTVALATAAAPALGGLILSVAEWRWLYAVNLPLGAGVLLAAIVLPAATQKGGSLDVTSAALNCVMFGSAILGVHALLAAPLRAVSLFAAAVVSGAILVRRELPKTAPLIPLDLLAIGRFRIAVVASVLCFTGQTAGLIALPFYLQHDLRLTPAATGLYMMLWPLGVAASAAVTGRLLDRLSANVLCAAGGGLLALGLATATLLPADNNPQALIAVMIMSGAGFGLFQTPNNRNMFLSAPRNRSAAAGATQGTARLTGQTFGALLVSLLFSALPLSVTPQIAFGIGALFAFAAALVSVSALRK